MSRSSSPTVSDRPPTSSPHTQRRSTPTDAHLATHTEHYHQLLTALEAGADHYLNLSDRSRVTPNRTWHGRDGIKRAQNIKQLCSILSTCDPLYTLALAWAIFKPKQGFFDKRSHALALLIAQQLITGDYSTTSRPDEEPTDIENLGSTYFNQESLASLRYDLQCLQTTVETDQSCVTSINKDKAATKLLKSKVNTLTPEERKSLTQATSLFRTRLTHTTHGITPDILQTHYPLVRR